MFSIPAFGILGAPDVIAFHNKYLVKSVNLAFMQLLQYVYHHVAPIGYNTVYTKLQCQHYSGKSHILGEIPTSHRDPGITQSSTLNTGTGKTSPELLIAIPIDNKLAPYGTDGQLLLMPTSKSLDTKTKIKNLAPISFRYCPLI